MRSYQYFKFSPSGNTTIFLQAAYSNAAFCAQLCKNALSHNGVGGEQAGLVDIAARSLVMSGGEFCANACRAFGALLDLTGAKSDSTCRVYNMRVSGNDWPVELHVQGSVPFWRVEAVFRQDKINIEEVEEGFLVHLPGISHLLTCLNTLPEPASAINAAKELIKKYHLETLDASGVIWWRDSGCELEMLPFVQVPKSGTGMLESSCGSGSIALALIKGKECAIRQPCGEILKININGSKCSLTGDVRLISRGEIWLE